MTETKKDRVHGSATRREIGALFVVFAVRVTSASHGYDVAVSGRYLSLDEYDRGPHYPNN